MSRTHNTDPYTIQGYRESGDRCPSNWREAKLRPPMFFHHPAWDEWWDDTHPFPDRRWNYDKRASSKKDRKLLQRRYRALVREAMMHEDYDADLHPENVQGWLWRHY